uniref:Uncharacterized protein n=1 Tax=Gasterosteus aculeatus TaxID=69293 RepID=G3ND99_GASAC
MSCTFTSFHHHPRYRPRTKKSERQKKIKQWTDPSPSHPSVLRQHRVSCDSHWFPAVRSAGSLPAGGDVRDGSPPLSSTTTLSITVCHCDPTGDPRSCSQRGVTTD